MFPALVWTDWAERDLTASGAHVPAVSEVIRYSSGMGCISFLYTLTQTLDIKENSVDIKFSVIQTNCESFCFSPRSVAASARSLQKYVNILLSKGQIFNVSPLIFDMTVELGNVCTGLVVLAKPPPLPAVAKPRSRGIRPDNRYIQSDSRPSGYLDIAWSQSPVNQISSDLADPADKTLHGKRKWQTAGDTRPDYEGSVKRD
ncbi:unnamed protein product [Scomber scombrus]|uniref:Unnamed protein product n=1 Tax=Scomber scombrus TaxID=13677 RepID=A0AAV1PWB5_SCOSC